MPTFVFFNVSAHGHINPTLPIVAELSRRGHTVYYFVNESFTAAIEKAGGIAVVLPGTPGSQHIPPPGDKEIALLPFLMARESPRIVPAILERLKSIKADCVLFNTMLLAPRIVSRILGLPIIGFRPFHSSRQPKHSEISSDPDFKLSAYAAEQALAAVATSYQLPRLSLRELYAEVPGLTLVFLPKTFQVEAAQFDERFLFVGPSFVAPPLIPWPAATGSESKTTRVYISLGTLRNNEPGFYRMCYSAFPAPDWSVVMSVGDQIDLQALEPVPANFAVKRSVPQTALLPHVDVFVTHGGLNSTMESLFYGIPLVVLPTIKEQETTAARVRELQLGIVPDKSNLTSASLREAVNYVLQNEQIRQFLQHMKNDIRSAGGYLRATDAITAYYQQAIQTR
ncbi:glycosyltransferase, MGT family [Chitinophaga rupis]|uniref:Glycosyltransferase, MGT family n=1 Tax=Chitinophaga rupis TaxID=573321 RepID=A0A1H8GAX6_9BACT|nr:macrolide family glycosyltransferase [Chitinophaga rupis]SEN41152.1 glycosyltransferase, MGT family [Chitinophaga rupis]